MDAYVHQCLCWDLYLLDVLAVIFRFLIAFKSVLEHRWIDAELRRRYIVVRRKVDTKERTKERVSSDSDSKRALLTENGVEEDVMIVHKHVTGVRPWRITTDGPRAVIDTVIAGILYLL